MIAKRASSYPFASLTHTEQKKELSAQIFLICERPDRHWRWLGTAKPASAENQGQAEWFLVPLKKITRAGHGLISEVILHLKLLKSQNAALLLERGALTPPSAMHGPERSSGHGSLVAGVNFQAPPNHLLNT